MPIANPIIGAPLHQIDLYFIYIRKYYVHCSGNLASIRKRQLFGIADCASIVNEELVTDYMTSPLTNTFYSSAHNYGDIKSIGKHVATVVSTAYLWKTIRKLHQLDHFLCLH